MRQALAVLALLLCSITSSLAQFSVNIGVNLPVYPQLVRVPGYPVYYAPQVNSNYFFYDGMYWVYADDSWYASTWYNGPWEVVAPDFVPLYVLRVPVRYYRRAPVYFRGWRADAPPRWGDHWGNTWYDSHRDWDRWNRSAAPAPAPLPVYQRQYSGNRYPQADQQMTLQTRNYRYEPRDASVQRQYQAQRAQAPAASPPGPVDRPRTSPAQQQAARPPSSAQGRPPQSTRETQQVARPPSSQQSTQQSTQQGTQQVARPPSSQQSTQQARPPNAQQAAQQRDAQQRDAQQGARPQSTQQVARPPNAQQSAQQRDAQQAARPQGGPPQNERAAQQAAHAPSPPQGRPQGAEQRAAAPPPPQASPPRGEPPARPQGGEAKGNGRGQEKDNKPD